LIKQLRHIDDVKARGVLALESRTSRNSRLWGKTASRPNIPQGMEFAMGRSEEPEACAEECKNGSAALATNVQWGRGTSGNGDND